MSNGFGLLNLGWHGATREDLITNVAMYVPLGLLLVLCGTGGRTARAALAVFVGAAVSLLAETLQSGIAARVASWMDVALNSGGTAIGVVLAVGVTGTFGSVIDRTRRKIAAYPFTCAAWLLTLG